MADKYVAVTGTPAVVAGLTDGTRYTVSNEQADEALVWSQRGRMPSVHFSQLAAGAEVNRARHMTIVPGGSASFAETAAEDIWVWCSGASDQCGTDDQGVVRWLQLLIRR